MTATTTAPTSDHGDDQRVRQGPSRTCRASPTAIESAEVVRRFVGVRATSNATVCRSSARSRSPRIEAAAR